MEYFEAMENLQRADRVAAQIAPLTPVFDAISAALHDPRSVCPGCGRDTAQSGRCSLCQEGYDEMRMQK